MSERVEYRVRPVTRYVVTRYHEILEDAGGDICAGSSCECKGEFDNFDTAYNVGYALAAQDHERLGYPIGDERIRYPDLHKP